jgi:hypothetical protein
VLHLWELSLCCCFSRRGRTSSFPLSSTRMIGWSE